MTGRSMVPALLLVGALSASSCSSNLQEERESRPGSTGTPAGATWCDSRAEENLECLQADGRFAAVLYRGDRSSDELTLWDPGGPGLGLPDEDLPMRTALPRSLRERNVLLAVEPWLQGAAPQTCTGPDVEARLSDRTCSLDDLRTTDASLRRLVTELAPSRGFEVRSAYLQSFGATRTLPALLARGGARPDWIVLDSPAPPVGTDATSLMRARVRGALQVLTSACGDDRDCRRRVRRTVLEPPGDPTEARDVGLGLFALAASPTLNEGPIRSLTGALSTHALGEEARRRLVRLGRQYSHQRQDGGAAPRLLALWADTCPRFRGWDELAASTDRSLVPFAHLYRGCALAQMQEVGPAALLQTDVPTLMVTGQTDAIVPPEMQRLWSDEGLEFDQVIGREHQSRDGRVMDEVDAWIDENEGR